MGLPAAGGAPCARRSVGVAVFAAPCIFAVAPELALGRRRGGLGAFAIRVRVLAFQLGAFLLVLGDELARGLFVKIFAVQQLLLLALALRHFLLELGAAGGVVFRLLWAVLRHDGADFAFLFFA